MEDKILEAFEFGKIQECRNIILKLREHGISTEEFFDWIDDMAKRVEPIAMPKIPNVQHSVLARHCPECAKAYLILNEVNNHPALMVGGDYKCQWLCPLCGWEEYSETRIEAEAFPYVEELKIIYVYLNEKKGCE